MREFFKYMLKALFKVASIFIVYFAILAVLGISLSGCVTSSPTKAQLREAEILEAGWTLERAYVECRSELNDWDNGIESVACKERTYEKYPELYAEFQQVLEKYYSCERGHNCSGISSKETYLEPTGDGGYRIVVRP